MHGKNQTAHGDYRNVYLSVSVLLFVVWALVFLMFSRKIKRGHWEEIGYQMKIDEILTFSGGIEMEHWAKVQNYRKFLFTNIAWCEDTLNWFHINIVIQSSMNVFSFAKQDFQLLNSIMPTDLILNIQKENFQKGHMQGLLSYFVKWNHLYPLLPHWNWAAYF